MLEPHPKTLRILLARYAEARITQAQTKSAAAAREIDDVVHALCAATSTACVEDAIAAADLLLAASSSCQSPAGVAMDQADLAA
ncbi:DUF5133 domain-containing protein [Streptomyces sp. NPDC006530]|uniref:DUF5133 domain-containing protein n=1 Tax=Streptomyces sp. NPDC006530 TaxID=3364750 RepID=UPI0036A1EFF0